ncbi:MAG: nucleotidyl transferase AbiEii/AbiGii toxin family protein [Phycisphaeraceae bacterium]
MPKQRKAHVDTAEARRTERIKALVVIAMFSDDELMERFVLKGGNAIDLAYHAGSRASLDIDLAMEGDFTAEEKEGIRSRIEAVLQKTFRPEGYEAFDVSWEECPERLSPRVREFWGGYAASFKLIEAARFAEFKNDKNALRRNAIQIGAKGKFEIDVSKFEFCGGKVAQDFDGYRIFVYTPAMVVCEKLRAICQQMPEYGPVVDRKRSGAARARDFVDIHGFVEKFKLDLTAPDNYSLLKSIFLAKRVPLDLLDQVDNYREFHRADFQAVKDTVKPGVGLREFDFYFDYVVGLCEQLKALRDV